MVTTVVAWAWPYPCTGVGWLVSILETKTVIGLSHFLYICVFSFEMKGKVPIPCWNINHPI